MRRKEELDSGANVRQRERGNSSEAQGLWETAKIGRQSGREGGLKLRRTGGEEGKQSELGPLLDITET